MIFTLRCELCYTPRAPHQSSPTRAWVIALQSSPESRNRVHAWWYMRNWSDIWTLHSRYTDIRPETGYIIVAFYPTVLSIVNANFYLQHLFDACRQINRPKRAQPLVNLFSLSLVCVLLAGEYLAKYLAWPTTRLLCTSLRMPRELRRRRRSSCNAHTACQPDKQVAWLLLADLIPS